MLESLLKKFLGPSESVRVDTWSDISQAFDDVSRLKLLGLHLFMDLNRELMLDLANKGTAYRYAPGDVIFRQGDIGDAFYFVKTGTVHATVQPAEGQKKILVKSISPGQYFGEFALLDESNPKRTATITAAEHTHVIRMRKEDFVSLLERNKEFYQELLREMHQTLRLEGLILRPPDGHPISPTTRVALETLGLGLCKKVKDGDLTAEEARALFDVVEKSLRQAPQNT